MKSESYELQVISEENNLAEVLFFVKQCLGNAGYAPKTQRQVATAAEEVFVNIAHYAFGSETGSVSVHMEITDDPAAVTLIFMDSGIPFDPQKEQDPDVTLPGEDRDIGGLGIFMTKMIMDELTYQYSDGQNILRMKKNL